MPKIKTSMNPTKWKRAMVEGRDPICDSKPVTYTEPAQRRMRKHFDMSEPKGIVENVDDNLLNPFIPVPALNETECRTLCALNNHKHLRRNQSPLWAADFAYRKSLLEFGICGNCGKPVSNKHSSIRSGQSLDSLTDKEVDYQDVPAHYQVFQHPTNPKKLHYLLVPKTRVFNQRCVCGGEMRKMLKADDK